MICTIQGEREGKERDNRGACIHFGLPQGLDDGNQGKIPELKEREFEDQRLIESIEKKRITQRGEKRQKNRSNRSNRGSA
jgi:hypothetical protein